MKLPDDQRRAMFAKKKFYHGTAGFRGRVIMADGLVPPSQIDMPHSRDEMRGPEFDEYVFLTTDKDLAKTHAERRARHWGDTEYGPIVYEVELDEKEVVPDTFDPIMYPDSFKYKGIIPRERVKKSKFSKDPKKFLMPDYIENPKDYAPVKVSVQKFKEYWERNPDNYFEKESVALEDRYEGVAKEVKKSKEIYMPEVYAKPGPEPSLDTVDVADGRHRSAAFIEHGIKEMKIVVPTFQKKWFEERMGV
jgi:hypothetical protein